MRENLGIRCRAHNRLAAVEVFGREHVQKKIDERQFKSKRAPQTEAVETAERRKRSEETPTAMLRTVEDALVKMGFKKKEAVAALETVTPRLDPKQRSLQALLREAIVFLTPPAVVNVPAAPKRKPEDRPRVAAAPEQPATPP